MSSKTVPCTGTSIELIIFGFMVSLTLKAGLDTAYSKTIPTATIWTELWQHILVWPSLQLLIFLITLVRFVYGAYRTLKVIEESPEELERWVLIWNIPGMLILFVLFYIASLSIQQPEPFYTSLIAIHIWDFFWFSILALFSHQFVFAHKFLMIDVLTLILLFSILNFSDDYLAISGAIAMVFLSVLDFLWNGSFFFYPNK
jgi:hypothetical protein